MRITAMLGQFELLICKHGIFGLVTVLALLGGANTLHAETPDEFRERKSREMAEFRNTRKDEMITFRDSINQEYASFLEQQWKQMRTLRNNRSFTPPPLTFAPRPSNPIIQEDTPDTPGGEPTENLDPENYPIFPEPIIPEVPTGREASFYGRMLVLYQEPLHLPSLRSIKNKDVADYWRALSRNTSGILEELYRIESEIGLDDWGVYQLAYELAPCYVDGITPNERVVFCMFVLSQRGFKCKMAERGNKLYPLMASNNELYNTMYIEFSDESTRYYVVTTDNLDDVNVCSADFRSSINTLDIIPPSTLTHIGSNRRSINRTWSDYSGAEFSCNINYDPEIVRYLNSYPCIDFNYYVEGPIDNIGFNQLLEQLNTQMDNMDTTAKLNHLLHFVQFAFSYKTDQKNYGYEKWNFPDATLAENFCDCEDRAILWSRLVKELVGVDVALVHYPGVHLAAAVAIDTTADYTTVSSSNRTYVLCDPTYLGANIGMEMPSLIDYSRTIIPLF